jgi:hypothetical protein
MFTVRAIAILISYRAATNVVPALVDLHKRRTEIGIIPRWLFVGPERILDTTVDPALI